MGAVFCGCRKKIANRSHPSFSPGISAGLEALPTSEVHGLYRESFLRQRLLHKERRRAVGYLLLLLLLVYFGLFVCSVTFRVVSFLRYPPFGLFRACVVCFTVFFLCVFCFLDAGGLRRAGNGDSDLVHAVRHEHHPGERNRRPGLASHRAVVIILAGAVDTS